MARAEGDWEITPESERLVGRTKRREIVMVISDCFGPLGPLEAALQRMRYHRHEVVVLQTLHPDELTLPFDRMTPFVGPPDELRRASLAALGEFNDQLEDICQRNRIERVLVDPGRDLGEVLVDYLNQRSRLSRGR